MVPCHFYLPNLSLIWFLFSTTILSVGHLSILMPDMHGNTANTEGNTANTSQVTDSCVSYQLHVLPLEFALEKSEKMPLAPGSILPKEFRVSIVWYFRAIHNLAPRFPLICPTFKKFINFNTSFVFFTTMWLYPHCLQSGPSFRSFEGQPP